MEVVSKDTVADILKINFVGVASNQNRVRPIGPLDYDSRCERRRVCWRQKSVESVLETEIGGGCGEVGDDGGRQLDNSFSVSVILRWPLNVRERTGRGGCMTTVDEELDVEQ
ncbi:repulsive guidance molecule A [Striga asiatica]|uniref:Repulsive guidance molecule A n=1 Tax=Striga asiatica TaxID=4170 RepID=A0A5A7RA89_STRAF|nr:repulsive guidance molecule A [Striga asiatica]